jgi:segregation and condensation protein A
MSTDTSYRRIQAPAVSMTPYTFQLDIFQGPLEVLLALVQRREVDVYRIQLLEILRQYSAARSERPRLEVDLSAEMLALSASLLLIKCRALLAQAPDDSVLESFLLPSTELLENLVNYCQFKAISEQLSQKEAQQLVHYTRPAIALVPPQVNRPPLETVEVDELRAVFRQLIARVDRERPKIHDEPWKLPDVIATLEKRVAAEGRIPLLTLIEPASSKTALIVYFLALLELLKRGRIAVEKETGETHTYWLTHQHHDTTHHSSPRRGRQAAEASQADS